MLATQPKRNISNDIKTDVNSENNMQQHQPVEPIQQDQHVQQVQQAQQAQPIVHNYNVYGNNQKDDSIIVKHDKAEQKFTLFNSNNQILGSFNILQLFKFLNKKHDFYLVDINIGSSDIIIKKYLYDDDKDVNLEYELLSHTESPFTGNVELLVKLYSDIIKIEDILDKELLNKPKEIAEDIQRVNNKFIYNLLVRLLKLINTISDTIQDRSIKENLLKYSVGAVYKISSLIKDDILIKKLQLDNIETDIKKLENINNKITEKINELDTNITTQNTTIDNLILQLNSYNQKGGSKSESTSKTASLYTSSKTSSNTTSNTTSNTISKTSSKIPLTATSISLNIKSETGSDSETETLTQTGSAKSIKSFDTNKTKSNIQSYKINTNIESTSTNDITLTITDTETQQSATENYKK